MNGLATTGQDERIGRAPVGEESGSTAQSAPGKP